MSSVAMTASTGMGRKRATGSLLRRPRYSAVRNIQVPAPMDRVSFSTGLLSISCSQAMKAALASSTGGVMEMPRSFSKGAGKCQ